MELQSPWNMPFESCLSPKPKSRAVSSLAKTSLNVILLAPCTPSVKFHIMAIPTATGLLPFSERLRLPDPRNIGGTSFRECHRSTGISTFLHRRIPPEFAIFFGLRNSGIETSNWPLLLSWPAGGSSQVMRTLWTDWTDNMSAVEGTTAWSYTRRGSTNTKTLKNQLLGLIKMATQAITLALVHKGVQGLFAADHRRQPERKCG